MLMKIIPREKLEPCGNLAELSTMAKDPLFEWIVDTGAAYHCVLKRKLFTKYKECDFGIAKMGNNIVSQIVGIGDIVVETSNSCTLTLQDVRHIPDMRMNLLSIYVLDNEGYESQQKNTQRKLLKGTLLVATFGETWLEVMQEEINFLQKNDTYELVELLKGKRPPLRNKGLDWLIDLALVLEWYPFSLHTPDQTESDQKFYHSLPPLRTLLVENLRQDSQGFRSLSSQFCRSVLVIDASFSVFSFKYGGWKKICYQKQGEKPKPAITYSTYNQWEAENSLVMSWWATMLKSINCRIRYMELNKAVCPQDATKFQKLVEKERIYDFLAGLNMEYDQIRVQVLVSVETAGRVSKTTREQKKTGDSSTLDKDQLKCDYCGKPGHTKDRYWKLHGRSNKSRGGKYIRSPRPQANMSETVETPASSEITNGGFSNEESTYETELNQLNISRLEFSRSMNWLEFSYD
ncbi:hypothetical protein RJ641_034553 [Dillenia turbinata]|uniref:Retrovirus-related Pol polyprotein from transposon TNT 1-94-like beta-barrel domain-containing protein n=1 Tax=Dillenia turbinata TaxID=194707 RepID=A0AAN8ZHP9_9MAGN